MDLQTERLTMRALSGDDLEDLARMHVDPTVREEFGAVSREELAAWIDRLAGEREELGYARSAIVDRVSGEFFGVAGLQSRLEELEVSWVLLPEARGRGVATEAAEAWIGWAFEHLKPDYVTAMIRPANVPSIAVAERCRMEVIRDDELHGHSVTVFARRSTVTGRPPRPLAP